MACGAAQPSQSPLAWLSGVQALVGRGNGGALVGRGDWWGAGPCAMAAVGLSEAGGRSWLGNAGEAGEPALQMGSRWLVLAFPGLRSELLITRSPSPPLASGDASALCGFPSPLSAPAVPRPKRCSLVGEK